MKKRLLSAVLAVAMLFGSAAALPQSAVVENTSVTASAYGEEKKSGNYEYRILKDGTAEIRKYNGKETKVTIPSKLGGIKVTRIGCCSFYECESLLSVIIPNNITAIGDKAFSRCKNLSSITIRDGVERIDESAFSYCSSLKTITIPSSVTSIDQAVFEKCTALKSVIIYGRITSINEETFSQCINLSSVTLPDSVTRIERRAFSYCFGLTSIKIPNSVKIIGEDAFRRCTSLTGVKIPNNVISIGDNAFIKCSALKYAVIPENVMIIGHQAFGYYYNKKTEKYETIGGFTIYGVKGSDAEKYANKNEIKFVAGSLEEPTVFRLAGANRYDTASHISNKMYGNSDTVIIATGLTFNDALVAVPLASAYDAPLLLTTDKQVTKYTEERLKKLNAKKVIIVSTSGAVGSKVKTALAKYDPTVISGKTCFETAAKVAKALQTKTKKTPDTIFFATDSSFADALSASPIAAIKGAPIMYLKNKGSIDKVTADYLKSVKGKVKNAYIIGGDGVISNAMMKNVANALGLTVNKTVQRVAGKNRYETCVAVNNKFAGLLTGKGICVAKGLDFPDALAGGVLAAKNRIPLFLADGKKLLDCQNTYLKGRKASKLYVFGGTGAVSDELVMLIAQASV